MKSMLYIGATLMIGACIYGFVDFKKANHNKEFRSLYNDRETKKTEEQVAVPAPENDNGVVPANENKKATTAVPGTKKLTTVRKMKNEKRLNYKLFSRAAPLTKFKKPEIITDNTMHVNQ